MPFIIVILNLLLRASTCRAEENATPPALPSCDSKIYCEGDLLHQVQTERLFSDSKTFVDMDLKAAPDVILEEYEKLKKTSPSRDDLRAFVDEYFVSNELDEWVPFDYKPDPIILRKIKKERVKNFVKKLIATWPTLGRRVPTYVKNNPDRYSAIYVPNGFIVPGGKYQELYYWHSFWIIKGLLLSEMYMTARTTLDNFCYLVEKYGFIPNGARVYYLNRSNPPLLIKMAHEYIKATNDIRWLKKNIGSLAKEVTYWYERKTIDVTINGKTYKMAAYITESTHPRPELYTRDLRAAENYDNEEDKKKLYREFAAASESGWGCSSRWVFDEFGSTMADSSRINVTRVVPVDLNAFLAGAFRNLNAFYDLIGDASAVDWEARASELKEAIRQVLWDEEDGIWYDYDTRLAARRKRYQVSNLTPLWNHANMFVEDNVTARAVTDYLRREGIVDFHGGFPATKQKTGQAWDLPNALPITQHIVIQGLMHTEHRVAIEISEDLLRRFLTSLIWSVEANGTVFATYDARQPGKAGEEQHLGDGPIGWTIGVSLELINLYYSMVESGAGGPGGSIMVAVELAIGLYVMFYT